MDSRTPAAFVKAQVIRAMGILPGDPFAWCHHCGAPCPLDWSKPTPRLLDGFQWDHHPIPYSAGGQSRADNIVVSCGPCNRAKGASLEWDD